MLGKITCKCCFGTGLYSGMACDCVSAIGWDTTKAHEARARIRIVYLIKNTWPNIKGL